jgi:hypothetical protein
MDIHAVYARGMRGFRRRRMQAFVRTFAPGAHSAILDVGGTPFNWGLVELASRVTLLNLRPPDAAQALPPGVACVRGDATRLAFPDACFEVAFSNSVIEHLGTLERQRRFAAEVRRVGRGVWVQTPARSFPFEPHLLAPFLHWLPRRWQRRLLRRASGWGLLSRPSQARVDAFLEETRLLTLREMRELFPDCEIRRERLLGLTKAYVAVRLPAPLR